jgi:segregation and condensation protein A
LHPTGKAAGAAKRTDRGARPESAVNTDPPVFLAELDEYRGPVDLLLYLVRRNELEIGRLPLDLLIHQYIAYLESLGTADLDSVGEFLDVASTRIETKMRSILPSPDTDDEVDIRDPREDLVRRLLLYKDFKDVSLLLEEQSREWQNRYTRLASDLPPREIDPLEQPIQEVELWDLVSSFGRVMRNNAPQPETSIVLDDTPIHVYMQAIQDRLKQTGRLRFIDLFEPDMHKSAIVGIFLAILELVRHHNVRTEQAGDYSDIEILPGKNFGESIAIDEVTDGETGPGDGQRADVGKTE